MEFWGTIFPDLGLKNNGLEPFNLFLCQVHPNPNRPAHLRLKMYEFAGRLVGKCLYESSLGGAYKQLVQARFTHSFLAQIIGLRMHYKVMSKCALLPRALAINSRIPLL